MKKKFRIDIETAKQLETLRLANDWSMRQLYLYFIGKSVDDNFDEVEYSDFDAFRKNIERKKDKPDHSTFVKDSVKQASTKYNDTNIEYKLVDDEIESASGSVSFFSGEIDDEGIVNPEMVSKMLFEKFRLSPSEFEVVSHRTVYTQSKDQYRIQASFKRKLKTVYDEEEVVKRYTKMLEKVGSWDFPAVVEIDRDNIMVINLADVHWNKMPHKGFDDTYLDRFERTIYDSLAQLMEMARHLPITRVAITVGHDFFQTNDSRGTTKKGTPVSNILEYRDMFERGVTILANCIALVGRRYVVDAYYVLANHDEDASWHATRELKILFKDVASINVLVDSDPFHYIEWGSTLIELIHENLKSGTSSSKMHVTASEAWGRTKYRYSIGGHLHGEYTTKELNGIVTMGSRALSDKDSWHVLNGYVANIRGLQAYVFNKDKGLISTFNANI